MPLDNTKCFVGLTLNEILQTTHETAAEIYQNTGLGDGREYGKLLNVEYLITPPGIDNTLIINIKPDGSGYTVTTTKMPFGISENILTKKISHVIYTGCNKFVLFTEEQMPLKQSEEEGQMTLDQILPKTPATLVEYLKNTVRRVPKEL